MKTPPSPGLLQAAECPELGLGAAPLCEPHPLRAARGPREAHRGAVALDRWTVGATKNGGENGGFNRG